MLKSVGRVWFVTYRGAFVMAMRTLDWDLHDDYIGLVGVTPQFYSIAPCRKPTSESALSYFSYISIVIGRGSAVGIETRPRAGRSGTRIPLEERDFSFFPQNRPDRLWGGPSSLSSNGYQSSFPRIKWPEREVCHSSTSIAELIWSHNGIQ